MLGHSLVAIRLYFCSDVTTLLLLAPVLDTKHVIIHQPANPSRDLNVDLKAIFTAPNGPQYPMWLTITHLASEIRRHGCSHILATSSKLVVTEWSPLKPNTKYGVPSSSGGSLNHITNRELVAFAEHQAFADAMILLFS